MEERKQAGSPIGRTGRGELGAGHVALFTCVGCSVWLGASVRMEKALKVIGCDEMVGFDGERAMIQCLRLGAVVELAVDVGQEGKGVGGITELKSAFACANRLGKAVAVAILDGELLV